MTGRTHIFGIRHHGPGSARALVEALDALRPVAVLIEGPADASDLLPRLADPAMRPPVALLAYPEDNPSATTFWPFAEFSPEYQAAIWAVRNGAALRFIDLPSTERGESGGRRDPIGELARAAGYEDAESWWSDVIEQNPAPGPIFAAVADAMAALREGEEDEAHEAKREAHMRLAIRAAEAEHDGPLAVVCGAWHAPALVATVAKKADQALVKGLARTKAAITFAPWTSPRLATQSGYGAGVPAPGWSLHVWRTRGEPQARPLWLARIAALLRAKGHTISTASLIEAERLAVALAALRERPGPGFEELREAAVAAMFNGEAALWSLVEAELLIGSDVGEIPADLPLAPLMEDLQRLQRETRLKPEALEREVALDLRSEAGLARSTLLHRLNALGVGWGQLTDAGRSRGTFRERWVLRWEPEHAVRLVENLVYGPTIQRAANGRLAKASQEAESLSALAELAQQAVTADLDEAAAAAIAALERRAALASQGGEMLAAIPPLADVVRYGQARRIDAGRLRDLAERLIVEAALALPHAARDLDEDAAATLVAALRAADSGVSLIEPEPGLARSWRDGLAATLDHPRTTPRVAGVSAHLLYEAGALAPEEAARLLGRRLSPGTPAADASGFFEGFFAGAGQRLIHDASLRGAVDSWLGELPEDEFIAYLPLIRRAFASLDRNERKRLVEAALGRSRGQPAGLTLAPDGGAGWAAQFERVKALLTGAAP